MTRVPTVKLHGLGTMRLIIGAPDDSPDFSGRVRRVWTREMGPQGHLHGMKIEQADSGAAGFLRGADPSPRARNWVRCLLNSL